MMKINDILTSLVVRRSKRCGRGIGSGKGKTCGRGVKGQGSRSGASLSKMEGGQQSFLRALPKRGFRSVNKKVYSVVSVERIANLLKSSDLFDSGEKHLSKEMMLKCGLVKAGFPVKILGSSSVTLAELGLLSCEYDKASSEAKRSFGFVQ